MYTTFLKVEEDILVFWFLDPIECVRIRISGLIHLEHTEFPIPADMSMHRLVIMTKVKLV